MNFLESKRKVVECIGADVFTDALTEACVGLHSDDALILLDSISTDTIEENEITASVVPLIYSLLPPSLRELGDIKEVIAAVLPDYVAPVALGLGGKAI